MLGSKVPTQPFGTQALWSQGKWRMWVIATAEEAGPDDLPDCQIHYLESDDGLESWSEPDVLCDEGDNYFDAVAVAAEERTELVVARGALSRTR